MGRKNNVKYAMVVCFAMGISLGNSMGARASVETSIENVAENLEDNTDRVTEESTNREVESGNIEEGDGTDRKGDTNGIEESTDRMNEENINRVPKPENVEAGDTREQTDAILCIELPPEYESGNSPFDFILDPQGVINATGAVRYGGRSFEEGATLYFENTKGDYNFSSKSDWLDIINKGKVTVRITIRAALNNLGDVRVVGDGSFTDDDTCSVYLALEDNQGNFIPLDEHGEAVIQEEISGVADEGTDAVYSFCLTGCCNPKGDWKQISDIPYVVVSWLVEPVINGDMEREVDILDGQQIIDDIGATASANVAYKDETEY